MISNLISFLIYSNHYRKKGNSYGIDIIETEKRYMSCWKLHLKSTFILRRPMPRNSQFMLLKHTRLILEKENMFNTQLITSESSGPTSHQPQLFDQNLSSTCKGPEKHSALSGSTFSCTKSYSIWG